MGVSVGLRVCREGHVTGSRRCLCGSLAVEVLDRPEFESRAKLSRRKRKCAKANVAEFEAMNKTKPFRAEMRLGGLKDWSLRLLKSKPAYSRELRALRNATRVGGLAKGFRIDLGAQVVSLRPELMLGTRF